MHTWSYPVCHFEMETTTQEKLLEWLFGCEIVFAMIFKSGKYFASYFCHMGAKYRCFQDRQFEI